MNSIYLPLLLFLLTVTTLTAQYNLPDAFQPEWLRAAEDQQARHDWQYAASCTAITLSTAVAELKLPAGALSRASLVELKSIPTSVVVPPSADFHNLVADAATIRILPAETKLATDYELTINLDATRLPHWVGPNDLIVMGLNAENDQWVEIPVQRYNKNDKSVSITHDHFTDFLAGVIMQPELPGVTPRSATEMSELTAADPTSRIMDVSEPTVNGQGDLSIKYPISLPPGRGTIMPPDALAYNSNGSIGHYGLGWSFNVLAITIDLRFGAARYHPVLDSETYRLNGRELTPVAYGAAWVPREAEKTFRLSLEDEFATIIRHGDSPKNYWWEVQEKDGTVAYYGGTPVDGLDLNAVLLSKEGNVAEWKLTTQIDANGNGVKYEYRLVTHEEPGKESGHDLYLQTIQYTTHINGEQGIFSVHFLLDDEIGAVPRRKDLRVDCKLGLRRVAASLVRQIDIRKNGVQVRSYQLDYEEDYVGRSLLSTITHLDQNFETFYDHKLEYYDDLTVNDRFTPYHPSKTTEGVVDHLRGNLLSAGAGNRASFLSTSLSNGFYAGIFVGIGPPGSALCKRNTVGGFYTFSRSKGTGLNTFHDLNGDGRPDKVFVANGGLYFRPNTGINAAGKLTFGAPQPARIPLGFEHFSRSVSVSHSYGPELNVKVGGFGGSVMKGKTKSKTTTTAFFQDYNADGFVDLVIGGIVYFNYHDETTGEQVFTPDSRLTPNPITTGIPLSGLLADDGDPNDTTPFNEANPLHDAVRVWRVPYDGTVRITGAVRLLSPSTQEGRDYEGRDGVVARVEYRDDVVEQLAISANDHQPHPVNKVLEVRAGKMIYFRVQSRTDGAHDQVAWAPTIQYIDEDTGAALHWYDANGLDVYCYNAAKDVLLKSPQMVGVPISGRARVHGPFEKPALSDTLRVRILRAYNPEPEADEETETLYSHTFLPEEDFSGTIETEFNLTEHDRLSFVLEARSQVDWKSVDWSPTLSYLSTTSNGNTISLLDSMGNSTLEVEAAVSPTMNNHVISHAPVRHLRSADEEVVLAMNYVPNFGPFGYSPDEEADEPEPSITVSLKGAGRNIYGSINILDRQNQTADIINEVINVPAEIRDNDSLYVEVVYSSERFANSVGTSLAMRLNGQSISYNTFAANAVADFAFGSLYRGWGQFSYRGEGNAGEEAIDTRKVREAFEEYRDQGDATTTDPDELEEVLDPTRDDVAFFYLKIDSLRWQGYDPEIYVGEVIMSASRLGEKNPDFSLNNTGGSGLRVASLLSRSRSTSKSGNLSFPVGFPGQPSNVSAQSSTTRGGQHILYRDLNGDRYPEAIANGYVQYTDPLGGWEDQTYHFDHPAHDVYASVKGVDLGGSLLTAKISNVQSPGGGIAINVKTSSGVNISGTLNITGGPSANICFENGVGVGISSESANNEDEVTASWLDVNGDGLPDQITKGGMVRLNYGRSFGVVENWGFNDIQSGKISTKSLALSLSGSIPGPDEVSENVGSLFGLNDNNKCNGSWLLGVTRKADEAFTDKALQDINGDGLVDKLFTSTSGNLYASLNYGQSFGPAKLWQRDYKMAEKFTATEGANGAFTVCFNIIFIRLCINPKGGVNRSVSTSRTMIADADNDGYPDLLASDREDELTVIRSRIGQTGKLKRVVSPLNNDLTISYEQLNPSIADPSARWVPSQVERTDGFAADGAPPASWYYHFSSGRYDRKSRTFFGFAEVVTEEISNDEVYRSMHEHYANDTYFRRGLLVSKETRDGSGNIWVREQTDYTLTDAVTGQVLPDDYSEAGGSVFRARTQVQSEEHEGQGTSQRAHRTHFTYDQIGNVITHEDFGDGTAGDYTRVDVDYHPETARGVADAPRKVSVFDVDGQLLRHRQAKIDAAGNETEIRIYYTPTNYAVTNMEYDRYGNVTHIVHPPNLHDQRYEVFYGYDDEVHRYVTSVVDAFGLRSTTTYNTTYGVPLEETDPNDQQLLRAYDGRGRLISITGPYELAAGLPYTIAITYHDDAPLPVATTRHHNSGQNNDIITHTFTDGWGRVLQTQKTAVVYDVESETTQTGMIISGRQNLDAFSRTIAAYHPRFAPAAATDSPLFAEDYDEVAPTRTEYDVLDRKTMITLPDGAREETAYSMVQLGNRPVIMALQTDPKGNRQASYTDLKGRTLRESTLDGPDGVLSTDYTYALTGERTRITDAAGNVSWFTYDLAGRQLTDYHPATGEIRYTYDAVGNQLTKSTPNLRETISPDAVIKYDYNFQRKVAIYYPDNIQNNVRLTYGAAGSSDNRAGRLILREDASGGQAFYYGPQGEVVRTVRTMIINATTILTYVSEATYDSWNRLQTMTYPDGELLDYTYDQSGQLTTVMGVKAGTEFTYVKDVGYDKFGAQNFILFGNDTEETLKRSPERRFLTKIQTSNDTAGVFQDYAFAYDRVGNILSIDNPATPRDGQLGGQTNATLEYDGLNRLKAATGSAQAGGRVNEYSVTMEYDRANNLRSKEQTHLINDISFREGTYQKAYRYAAEQPFRPVQIGLENYSYDQNGNVTMVEHQALPQVRELFWDEENRLSSVREFGYVSNYTYDSEGLRAIKSHGVEISLSINGSGGGFTDHQDEFTAYVSPYFTVTRWGFTKHYFAGNQRIASKVGVGRFANNSASPGTARFAAGGIDYAARVAELEEFLREQAQGSGGTHPNDPLFFGQPSQTGTPYPAIFPASVAISTDSRIGTLPPYDPSGAAHPAFDYDQRPDTLRPGAGYILTGSSNVDGARYYYHNDHLGSTAYVTDQNGNVNQYSVYSPWGELMVEERRASEAGSDQPYRFSGNEFDRETGLIAFDARYYNPVTSLWLSADPLRHEYPGFSPYNYVLHNPVKLVDPDGRYPAEAMKSINAQHNAYRQRNPLIGELVSPGMVNALESANNFFGGFADALTGGLVGNINKKLHGTEFAADENSAGYGKGELTGTAVGMAISHGTTGGASWALKGKKILDGLETAGTVADVSEKALKGDVKGLSKFLVKQAAGRVAGQSASLRNASNFQKDVFEKLTEKGAESVFDRTFEEQPN